MLPKSASYSRDAVEPSAVSGFKDCRLKSILRVLPWLNGYLQVPGINIIQVINIDFMGVRANPTFRVDILSNRGVKICAMIYFDRT